MSRKRTILKGTLILTITGFLTRLMGFFYRIFLSHTIGEEGIGLYQLVFPVYALGFTFTSAGIELALSRSVSKYLALNNKKRASEMLYTGIILSLSASVIFTLILQRYASFIANNFLHNTDTLDLLFILSYIFPFASIHSCIAGYYLGKKETKLPASSQLFEQIFRIGSVIFIYYLSKIYPFKFNITFAVVGLLIGELASCLFCIKSMTGSILPTSFPSISAKNLIFCSKELLVLASPVTASRMLLNILQSIEAVSIPLSLQLYGMSKIDALSTYGVFSGMALPCILFPSALTNAVSTMLLPTVAEMKTINDQRSLNKIVQKTVTSCTFMGILCCLSFLLLGNAAGKLLFNSTLAGKFILTLAWMCPFLYTNNTLISIINGLGKTWTSFTLNALSLGVRIFCVFYIIPSYGIYGYLVGLLFSQIFMFISCLLFLYKKRKTEVS